MSATDRIGLRGVRAAGRHGAGEGEREVAQVLCVDVDVDADLSRARKSDALEDAIDYAALHRRVVDIVASTSFALLERLGEAIVADLMRDERVTAASVTIAKPGLLDGATPAVTVSSSRTG